MLRLLTIPLLLVCLTLTMGLGCAPKKVVMPKDVSISPSLEFPPSQEKTPLPKKRLKKEFVVGCLLPLSGKFKHYGQSALKGIELAFDLYNRSGRLPAVSLAIRDTGGTEELAIKGLNELIVDDGADLIIGPMASKAARAVSKQTDLQVPIIIMSQAIDIPLDHDYIFRHFLTPRQQVAVLVSHAVEKGCVTFSILYPNDHYGQLYRDIYFEEVKKKGGITIAAVAYDTQETDFGNQIKKLIESHFPPLEEVDENQKEEEKEEKDKKPDIDFDALFIPDSPDRLTLIIPQLAYYDVEDIMLLGNNLWHSQKLLSETYKYLQGAFIVDAFNPFSKRLMVQNYIRTFYATYETQPTLVDALAFDTMLMAIASFQSFVHSNSKSIREALLLLKPYDGITGVTKFRSDGEAQKKLILFQTRGKKFEEIFR